MAPSTCRACAGFLARSCRPLSSAATRRTELRPFHQACLSASFVGQQRQTSQTKQHPSTQPQLSPARPRPRRPISAAERTRSFHASASAAGIADRIGNIARQAVQRTIEPYGAFGVTRQIYNKCARQAAYEISEEARRADTVPTTEDGEEIGTGGGMWHDDFHLLPSFSTWAQVTMLHMYLVVTRLRCLEKETYQMWQSMLTDHFFQEAEEKMDRVHHLTSRGLRQRYLQDLFVSWRGLILAYDEGLMRGDAVLAAAVWRNLFKGREDIDLRALAAVVAWMRRSLAQIDRMGDEALILHAGRAFFTWPPATADLATVDQPATKELGLLLQQQEALCSEIQTQIQTQGLPAQEVAPKAEGAVPAASAASS